VNIERMHVLADDAFTHPIRTRAGTGSDTWNNMNNVAPFGYVSQIGYHLKLAYFTNYYCNFKEGYLELVLANKCK
jgi:hypothetical protein